MDEEKIPLVQIINKRKRAAEDEGIEVCKRRKMTSSLLIVEEKSRKRGNWIEMADYYHMSRKRGKSMVEDEGDITLMEIYKKIKRMQSRRTRKARRRRLLYAKDVLVMTTPLWVKDKAEEEEEEEKIEQMSSSSKKGVEIVQMSGSPSTDDKESCFLGKYFGKSSEEDSEEEKKHVRRSPVYIKRFADHVNLELCGIKVKNKEPEQESDEELLRECQRKEVDHGYNYVLKKRFRAVTNPINPLKVYYKSGIDSGRTKHVLHDPNYPLATFSKLALKTYNDIQGTEYAFVGLVKAYMRFIGGWRFWIRFKANAVGQDAINFQTILFEAIRNRKTNVVSVRVESVYPLPPW